MLDWESFHRWAQRWAATWRGAWISLIGGVVVSAIALPLLVSGFMQGDLSWFPWRGMFAGAGIGLLFVGILSLFRLHKRRP